MKKIQQNEIKCTILSGIPCSGKSSWARKQGLPIISCDDIREELYGKDYKFNSQREKHIWEIFYVRISEMKESFIIDNTNTKSVYIQTIRDNCQQVREFEIKYFPCSLTKAYYRNIIRYCNTGKYIPFKVIRNMYKNYKYYHG